MIQILHELKEKLSGEFIQLWLVFCSSESDSLRIENCLLLPLPSLQSLPPCGAHCRSPGKLTVLTRSQIGCPQVKTRQSHDSYQKRINHCASSLHSAFSSRTSWHSDSPPCTLTTEQKIMLSPYPTLCLTLHSYKT